MSQAPASAGLLSGIRVIDLSQYIPGPFATRQLADLGADVIKLEPPQGDPMRRFMSTTDGTASPVYRHLNRGKRVCRVDLKTDAGRRRLENLLADADILLESFRPGVLERLGFDRERIESINPGLIHCALSGYGQTGPDAGRAGHDINYCALSSQGIVSGSAERPVIGFPPIADHASAMQACIVILAALQARTRHARGAYLDVSMTETMLSWQYLPLLTNSDRRAAGILDGGAACYNLYRCRDAVFVSLGAIETAFWENFCTTVERPDWVDRQHEPMPQTALIDEVGALFATEDATHWARLLRPVDCCFEILLQPDQVAAQPQFAARGAIGEGGPTYPVHIDQEPVNPVIDFEEDGEVEWRPRG